MHLATFLSWKLFCLDELMASASTSEASSKTTSPLWSPRRSGDGDEPIQLYKSTGSYDEAQNLLDKVGLTDQDVIDFLNGKPVRTAPSTADEGGDENEEHRDHYNISFLRKAFQERKAEIRQLSQKLATGEARIDEYDRLVPVSSQQQQQQPRPAQQAAAPVPPRQQQQRQQQQQQRPNLMNHQGGRGGGVGALAIGVGGGGGGDPERLFSERDELEAAEAIARAVRRYREEGVPEEEFELIRIETQGERTNNMNLTFRRVCIAVLAVVTAFVCVILQTLPLLQEANPLDPTFDALMYELLHVRHLYSHVSHCPGLHREGNPHWKYHAFKFFGFHAETECDDGVLHIPAKQLLRYFSTREERAFAQQFAAGVNVSWFMPCHPLSDAPVSSCYPGASIGNLDATCRETVTENGQCFRGIHDGVVSDLEIRTTLGLGNTMILNGGDHFDIHYDVSYLQQQIPSVVQKLRTLLRDRYDLSDSIRPVAFRVMAVGPMDAAGVDLDGSSALALNQTMYTNWVNKCKHHNEMAQLSLPWPLRVEPARDTCNVMADLEADPKFAIHTTLFLSDGGGFDYRGGVALYIDNHKSNSNPRHRVRRGVTIDGTRGRVVVSTGGMENRRCRLPTRAGLRTTLQIWWGC